MRFLVSRILGIALVIFGGVTTFYINHYPSTQPDVPSWFAISLMLLGFFANSAGEAGQLRKHHQDKRSYLTMQHIAISIVLGLVLIAGFVCYVK